MKKFFLHMLLRATQTTVIAVTIAIIFNFFINNFPRVAGDRWDFKPDWNFVINETLIAIFLSIGLLILEKLESKLFTEKSDKFEQIACLYFSFATVIASFLENIGILKYHYHIADFLCLSSVVIVLGSALFRKKAGPCIFFGLVFTGIFGMLNSVPYWSPYDFWNSITLMTATIIVGRIIRLVVVFLFYKEHSFLKEEVVIEVAEVAEEKK